jgi:predicted ATPase/class 3 adenylate cyclase
VSRRELPTGTLTFLFTDLEGSTRLLHEFPDEYGSLLETHRTLIREAVAACDGLEFGTGGDALFVVFESPAAAVECARRAQQSLQAHPWPVATPLKVRMALHTGEAEVVDDDYVGIPLHAVARLCGAGHGGQVLLSSTTRALVSHDIDVIDLGSHDLRDVAQPMQIFQLCGDGLPREFAPLRTRSAQPNNLPSTLDRLIGRDLETVEVIAALHDHRLVTLTGSGGSGKTRLALEVGAALVGEYADGVWFLELAAATTPDQVLALLAQTLRVGERSGVALSSTVVEYLEARDLLLIFDNCEHLIDAVATLAQELASRCRDVRLLATSRELLGIRGEQAISVAPLSVGDASRPGDAMLLFIERVKETSPEFDVSGRELAVIADVCERLDGLPLAIELAAARMRTIALPQLAARLHDRFRLLTGGARTALGRQRTLEAVVAWSYDLLTPSEQRLFRYLAVFSDSFPLDAVEAVAHADEQRDVIDTLGLLVDKSLVLKLPHGTGSRYQMLETIRQYARDRLVEQDESDHAHRQLLAWVLTLTVQLETDMRTARQDAAIRAVLPERSNARTALEWAVENDDLLSGLRIASAIPLMITSKRRELLEHLLDRTRPLPDARRAQALLTLGNLSMEQGHLDASAAFIREAAELFEALGDRRHAAWAHYFEIFAFWGDPECRDRGHELANQMIDAFREFDDDFGLAYALWVASQFADDPDEAQRKANESERLFRRLNAPFGLAHALEGRALICLKTDATTRDTEATLAEALSIFAEADNFGCTAHCLEAIAAVLATADRVTDAATLLGAAQRLRDEVGQEHRAWEREGRIRTRQAFDRSADLAALDRAEADGRALAFADAVAHAHALLGAERIDAAENPH